ncbi:MAG: hypothetical protein ACP5OC_07295 [Thermoplasmata archaeon]
MSYRKYFKVIPLMFAILMVFSSFAFIDSDTSVSYKGVSPSVLYSVPIIITNNGTNATPVPFDEEVVVNSSYYSVYENANLSNVFFSFSNGTIIPSWLQSGNSNTLSNTTYWLRLNQSIAPLSQITVYMNFLPIGGIAFNGITTGEAPELTPTYGYYDNGASVFNFYSNFSGTSLNGHIWNTGNSNKYTVNNGISFYGTPGQIVSNQAFGALSAVQAFGLMANQTHFNETSCFLGGVGFGHGGIEGGSVVMTSGWAENNTNWLGLSIWDNAVCGVPYGVNAYGYSRSLNPNDSYVYGVTFLNGSSTLGTINNVVMNKSHALLYSSPTDLNVVMGFQNGNYPELNHFYWVFERNSTTNGYNLPYSFNGDTYKVSIVSHGLPSNDKFAITIKNLTQYTVSSSGLSEQLVNGTYFYTVNSLNSSYAPIDHTGQFNVSGSSKTVTIDFNPVTFPVSFDEVGLAPGSSWQVVTGNVSNISSSSSLSLNLMNGSYDITISDIAGYQANPDVISVNVNGISQSYEVAFTSPANLSVIRSLSTLYTHSNTTQSGNYLIGGFTSTGIPAAGIAVDQNNNRIFYLISSEDAISIYNITTGSYQPIFKLHETQQIPLSLYYSQTSGLLYLYSAGIKNASTVSILDPNNMSLVKEINLPTLFKFNFARFTVDGANSSLIFLTEFNLSTYIPTVATFTTGGVLVDTTNFSKFSNQYLVPILLSPPSYKEEVLLTNTTSLDIMNVSSGTSSFLSAPAGDELLQPVELGNSPIFFIGYSRANVTVMFNISTGTFYDDTAYSFIPVTSGYDPFNGVEYVSVLNPSQKVGGIVALNATTGRILAQILLPISEISLALEMSSMNQSLISLSYMANSGSFSGQVLILGVQEAYNVTFSESGLPSGADWFVNISGRQSSGAISSGSTLSTNLVNGTYSYSTSTTDKKFEPVYANTFAVSGSSLSVNVTFKPVVYAVTFRESGLPATESWYVNVTGETPSGAVLSTSFSESLQNGSYVFAVTTSDLNYAAHYISAFTVSGANVLVNITFSQIRFAVTFTETGLPAGTSWNITVDGVTHAVAGTSLTIYFLNGTYSYSTKLTGYTTVNGTGNITVSGHKVSISISFKPVSSSTGIGLTDYIAISVVVAVIVVVGLVLYLRKKK